jgi:hypothetical protein
MVDVILSGVVDKISDGEFENIRSPFAYPGADDRCVFANPKFTTLSGKLKDLLYTLARMKASFWTTNNQRRYLIFVDINSENPLWKKVFNLFTKKATKIKFHYFLL